MGEERSPLETIDEEEGRDCIMRNPDRFQNLLMQRLSLRRGQRVLSGQRVTVNRQEKRAGVRVRQMGVRREGSENGYRWVITTGFSCRSGLSLETISWSMCGLVSDYYYNCPTIFYVYLRLKLPAEVVGNEAFVNWYYFCLNFSDACLSCFG